MRSLQIKVKVHHVYREQCTKVQRCEKAYTLSDVSREDIDCIVGDQEEFGPALERGGTLAMAVRMAELTGCRANGRIRA